MLYYSKNGTIDEDIYNRVIQNIIAGKCPHIQDTTPSLTTSVSGMYIAAAVNSDYLIKKYLLPEKQNKTYVVSFLHTEEP